MNSATSPYLAYPPIIDSTFTIKAFVSCLFSGEGTKIKLHTGIFSSWGIYISLLVNNIDAPINWHLNEQLTIGEKGGLNLLIPLGKECNPGEACRTYLSRRKVWEPISK